MFDFHWNISIEMKTKTPDNPFEIILELLLPSRGGQPRPTRAAIQQGFPSYPVENSSPLELSSPYQDESSSWWNRKPRWTIYNHLEVEEA